MRNVEKGVTCSNCGAPITTEICPFCGSSTGLKTEQANMDYPVMVCKEAHLGFWSVAFPGMFAVAFGIVSIIPIFIGLVDNSIDRAARDVGLNTSPLLSASIVFCLPFLIVSLIALYIVISRVSRYNSVKRNGKRITATVYGYMNDHYYINDAPAQIVKLLVDTPQGKRFILYQLGSTIQPYGINTKIDLLYYNNMFIVENPIL